MLQNPLNKSTFTNFSFSLPTPTSKLCTMSAMIHQFFINDQIDYLPNLESARNHFLSRNFEMLFVYFFSIFLI